MALRVTTAATETAVSLAEAKAHLGVEFDDDNALILAMIAAAQRAAEVHTQRRFCTQSMEWTAPSICCALPIAPVAAASVAVRYVPAGAADLVAFARDNYRVRQWGEEGGGATWIVPKISVAVPCAERDADEPIVIAFNVGQAAAAIAADVKAAIKIMVGDLYKFRESVADKTAAHVPMTTTVEALLSPYVWA